MNILSKNKCDIDILSKKKRKPYRYFIGKTNAISIQNECDIYILAQKTNAIAIFYQKTNAISRFYRKKRIP